MKSGMTRVSRLMLIWVLMIVSGCSLTSPSGGSSGAVFEGPPVIRIASPLPNQTFLAGATVIIQARIENAGPDLARVSVLLDDELVGEQPNPNEAGAAEFSVKIDWPTSIPGQYEIAVAAERGDGAVTRETVTVTVIDQTSSGLAVGGEPSADEAAASAAASEAAPSPTPTMDAPSPSLGSLPAKVTTAANLRAGPGTRFDPPLGSLAADQEVEIVAANPAGDWYKIRYDGRDAWIYAESVNVTGDAAGLPLDTGVNLAVGDIAIDPHPLVCGEPARIDVTVRNEGTVAAAHGGWIRMEAILKSTSEVLESAVTVFPAIAAGGTFTASASLTVGIHYNETQSIRVTVDIPNQVDESNEDDNVSTAEEYVLQQGGCS